MPEPHLDMHHPYRLLLALLPLSSLAAADIVWTGATSNDIFDESNWDLSNSSVTVIDPNVSIDDNVVITNAPLVEIPDVAGQQRFQVGNGFTLTLNNSKLSALGNDGVGGVPMGATGMTVLAVNGSEFNSYFIVYQTLLDLDATSNASFGGPATPINGSFVDLTLGSVLSFTNETPQDYIMEHLSKTTVDGIPAVVGVNLQVVSDGAAGCIVSVIGQNLGINYCSANTNSSGMAASISATGNRNQANGPYAVDLAVNGLPTNQFGYFLAGRIQGFIPLAGGSQGNLCIVVPQARLLTSLQGSGAAGEFQYTVDVNQIPLNPAVAIQPGETWNFQGWYRDVNPGQTSNFTDGLEISFL